MEKKALEFRTLQAGEIDCRIATVTEKGVSLLLYKDARVDQNILDETVGPMNWQRPIAETMPTAQSASGMARSSSGFLKKTQEQKAIQKRRRGLPPTPLNGPALTGGLAGNCIQRHLFGSRWKLPDSGEG